MRKIKYTKFDYVEDEQILKSPLSEMNHPDTPIEYSFIHKCNFYKLFWIFLIGSIFGCYLEQIQYYFIRGIWESRAGVIWGPFSEIYGLGAVLMFLIYQKLKNNSPLTIFCAATVYGSAFEYCASYFQEVFLGSVTWNYSSEPFNIGGRTSLKYGMYWGLLGLAFIKWIFPLINRILENIKGKLPFILTWVFILFISFDLIFSALAINRWNERMKGIPSDSYIDEFMDSHYENDKMKQIYPHMKFIDTSNQIRTSKPVEAGLNKPS